MTKILSEMKKDKAEKKKKKKTNNIHRRYCINLYLNLLNDKCKKSIESEIHLLLIIDLNFPYKIKCTISFKKYALSESFLSGNKIEFVPKFVKTYIHARHVCLIIYIEISDSQ